jgi:hypothetical protein
MRAICDGESEAGGRFEPLALSRAYLKTGFDCLPSQDGSQGEGERSS